MAGFMGLSPDTQKAVPLKSSIETVSREATGKMAHQYVSRDMLQSFLVEHFLYDGLQGWFNSVAT
jgi:hypothetical protein